MPLSRCGIAAFGVLANRIEKLNVPISPTQTNWRTIMYYFITLETSHGPYRAAWHPTSEIYLYSGADEEPEKDLGKIPSDNQDSIEKIWSFMVNKSLLWLISHNKEFEIHGITRSMRQVASLGGLFHS